MNTLSYKRAGVGAIVLALLFPIYWLFAVTNFSLDAVREDFVTLSGWDLLFVIIGVLEIVVYLALARLCRDQLGGTVSAIFLFVMAGMIGLLHATTLVDVLHGIGVSGAVSETLIGIGIAVSLASLFLYTVAALALAISFLVRFTELPTLMRCFSIGLLIACLLQLTVVLGVINIFLFPLLLLLLGVHFLRGEHAVEVV